MPEEVLWQFDRRDRGILRTPELWMISVPSGERNQPVLKGNVTSMHGLARVREDVALDSSGAGSLSLVPSNVYRLKLGRLPRTPPGKDTHGTLADPLG